MKSDRTLIGLVTETDLLRAALLPELEQDANANETEETIMSELKEKVQREIDELRRVRDELKVRIHLAKAEAKDRWDELENQFRRLESKGHQMARASEEPLRDVGDAARLLVDELREGYRRIREAL